MCGIYGAVGFNTRGKDFVFNCQKHLERVLLDRGRDGGGVFVFEGGYIGASRAQSLTEGEKTPIPLHHNDLVMVFNGTLSNDVELTKKWHLRIPP